MQKRRHLSELSHGSWDGHNLMFISDQLGNLTYMKGDLLLNSDQFNVYVNVYEK